MFRFMCKSKLHRVRVTDTCLEYEGSIAVARELLERAGILPGERVAVYNVTTGARLETYVIDESQPGVVRLNGAAARLAQAGDELIVVTYALMAEDEAQAWKPRVVLVDAQNRPREAA
jgi:aspartate 1-decarboxylase